MEAVMWQLTVNGAVVPLVADGFQVEQTIDRRPVSRFTIDDEDRTLTFDRDDRCVLTIAATAEIVFGGIVDVAHSRLDGDGRKWDLTVVGWHELAGRRIAARSYEDVTAGAIVTDLHDRYLADEGITLGTIEDGPTIVEAIANYAYVDEVLDALAEKAGLSWWISPDLQLHFRDPAGVTAPFDLDGTTIYGRPDVDWGNTRYRNRQYVRGGKDITDPQTETKTGDGEAREFTLAYPLAAEPTVTVNAAAQTVGVKGVDTGKDWYWAKGDAVLSQEATDLRLTGADTLEVTYVGEYSIVALAEDPVEIADRAAAGGTGYVEAVHDSPNTTGRDKAFEVASSRLDRFARAGTRTVVRTELPGLAAGQTVRVTIGRQSLDMAMVIESLRIVPDGERIDTDGRVYVWEATCVDGPTGSWADLFAAPTSSAVDLVNVGGGDVLALLTRISEQWAWSEEVTQTAAACQLLDADLPFELC